MDFPQRAVLFLEEDSSLPAHSKPLMLEAVLFCPILKWMSDKLLADGVQRFFVVSSPRFAQEVRACFPEDADVTISEQHSQLLDFLNTPDPVAVFVRAALPVEEAGPGFVYGAAGYELQEVWREKMTNAVSAAELLAGWLPVYSLDGNLCQFVTFEVEFTHVQCAIIYLKSVIRFSQIGIFHFFLTSFSLDKTCYIPRFGIVLCFGIG